MKYKILDNNIVFYKDDKVLKIIEIKQLDFYKYKILKDNENLINLIDDTMNFIDIKNKEKEKYKLLSIFFLTFTTISLLFKVLPLALLMLILEIISIKRTKDNLKELDILNETLDNLQEDLNDNTYINDRIEEINKINPNINSKKIDTIKEILEEPKIIKKKRF